MSKKKLVILIVSVVLGLVLIGGGIVAAVYFTGDEYKKKDAEGKYTYEEAMEILNSGDQGEGIKALRNADGKEAAAKRKELYLSLYGQEFYDKIHNAKVGDVITFGTFEQDDNLNNGSEDVEWLVLDKEEDGRLFVVTKYAIECVRYHKKAVDITWEECFLRSWLNDGFIKDTFSEEESWIIPTIYVENKDNPQYGTEAGNDTLDKVFLLSIEEAQKYFDSDRARMTSATEIAKLHYAYADSFDNTAWWLRTPSFKSNKAALVADDGEILIGAYHKVTEMYIATRPAMWIDLS